MPKGKYARPDSEGLTRIWHFLASYHQSHGWMPSQREIMAACQFKTVSAVAYHLNTLEKRGIIERPARRTPRSIKLLKKPPRIEEG